MQTRKKFVLRKINKHELIKKKPWRLEKRKGGEEEEKREGKGEIGKRGEEIKGNGIRRET